MVVMFGFCDRGCNICLCRFKISSTIEKLLDNHQSCDAVEENHAELQTDLSGTKTKSKIEDVLIKV